MFISIQTNRHRITTSLVPKLMFFFFFLLGLLKNSRSSSCCESPFSTPCDFGQSPSRPVLSFIKCFLFFYSWSPFHAHFPFDCTWVKSSAGQICWQDLSCIFNFSLRLIADPRCMWYESSRRTISLSLGTIFGTYKAIARGKSYESTSRFRFMKTKRATINNVLGLVDCRIPHHFIIA